MLNVVDVQLSSSSRSNGTGIAVRPLLLGFMPEFVEICYFLVIGKKKLSDYRKHAFFMQWTHKRKGKEEEGR